MRRLTYLHVNFNEEGRVAIRRRFSAGDDIFRNKTHCGYLGIKTTLMWGIRPGLLPPFETQDVDFSWKSQGDLQSAIDVVKD